MSDENHARLERHGFEYLENGVLIPIPADCMKEIIVGHNFDWGKYENNIRDIVEVNGLVKIKQTKIGEPFNIDIEDITNKITKTNNK